jgi:Cell division protein CrgA
VPKSKVRKKDPAAPRALSSASASPMKALAPSPTWYPILMAVVLVIGLAYLVAYYLASADIPFMSHLGAWNFAVGFGILVVGLVMAVRWR